MNRALQRIQPAPIVHFKNQIKGEKIAYDLSQAVPSYPTFPAIKNYLSEILKTDAADFYTDIQGLKELREEIVKWHPLSLGLSSENILITPGANMAMYLALSGLYNREEQVCLLEPYYFNYEMALQMFGLVPVSIALEAENGFQLNAKSLIEKLEKTQVKSIILISPNNPTGACYDSAEILKLLEWSAPKNIDVILDETYLSFSETQYSENLCHYLDKNLSLVGSFSKNYSLTGYRVGYLVTQNEKLKELLKLQDTSVICAPHLSQRAALFGMQNCKRELDIELDRMRQRVQMFKEMKKLGSFEICSVGPYFAYLKHPYEGLNSEEAAIQLFKETAILTLPGEIFGRTQASYVRVAHGNLQLDQIQEFSEIWP